MKVRTLGSFNYFNIQPSSLSSRDLLDHRSAGVSVSLDLAVNSSTAPRVATVASVPSQRRTASWGRRRRLPAARRLVKPASAIPTVLPKRIRGATVVKNDRRSPNPPIQGMPPEDGSSPVTTPAPRTTAVPSRRIIAASAARAAARTPRPAARAPNSDCSCESRVTGSKAEVSSKRKGKSTSDSRDKRRTGGAESNRLKGGASDDERRSDPSDRARPSGSARQTCGGE